MKGRTFVHDPKKLYEESLRILKSASDLTPDSHRRLVAVSQALGGEKTIVVAKRAGVSQACLNLWIRRVDAEGFDWMLRAGQRGRQTLVSPEQKELVFQAMESNPKDYGFAHWNNSNVIQFIREQFGVEISHRTASRIIAEWNRVREERRIQHILDKAFLESPS